MAYLHPDLRGHEFNFHQIAMKPMRIPDFPRNQVSLYTRATRDLYTHAPLASAPMDTVTEYASAIAIERRGGIGVVHFNFPDIDSQVEQIRRIKNYKAAFVKNPTCLKGDNTISDLYQLNEKRGFFSVPITLDGTPHTPMDGFVSRRDIRYIEDRSTKLENVMTPREKLITAHRKETLDNEDIKVAIRAANKKIRTNNLDTLIIVDDDFRPCALVTDRDLQLDERYPNASVDKNKQLYAFAAIRGDWHDSKRRGVEEERIRRLVEAGVDGLAIDQGVVYASQPEIARHIKKHYPHVQVGAGNVGSGKAVEELMELAGPYIDFIKAGVSPGAACKTLQELGVGVPQPSAVYECAEALKPLRKKHGHVSLWADGGVKVPGDAVELIGLGADYVMVGNVLAGAEEAPGEKKIKPDGRHVKEFRGMGSLKAMDAGGEARYSFGPEDVRVEEGLVLEIPIKGPADELVFKFLEGMRQSMNKLGIRNIDELHDTSENGCWIIPYSRRD